MRIKIFSLSAGLLLAAAISYAQDKDFTISGNIKGKNDGYIYLSYKGNSYDSSLIRNGRFNFKGTLDGPVLAYIMMDRNTRFFDKYTQIYLVPAPMKLLLDYNNFAQSAVLEGSPVQAEADQLAMMKAPVMEKIKPLSEQYNKANMTYINARKEGKDEATLADLKEKANNAKDAMDPYDEQLEQLDRAFMDKHPSSYVTASLMRYRISGMQLSEAENRYNQLSAETKNCRLGKEIKASLEGLRMGSPGARAYVFASTELRGTPLSLADYKGKYVLVDFWASWCVPCRKGNPHLLSLYKKYHDKGFEVIGVSDDDGNADAWKKAVEKDGIDVWNHVLRGLKWKDNMPDRSTDISENYGIHSLPTKILIDPEGIIIGRYGGGGENDEAMDKKLAAIFGN